MNYSGVIPMDYEMIKIFRELNWIFARVQHLEEKTDIDFYKHPELIPEHVPATYCGEFFDVDSVAELPKNVSDKIFKAYRAGYIRGYNRGIERIKPHGSPS